MNSSEKTFMSFFWVFIERFGNSGITLISTLLLARLLTPYDFGIIGTVAIFISVSDMIVEAGFGAALVQKKEITNADYSTVFVFNAVISLLLYIILFFTAPYISVFYENNIYTPITRILGLKLLINAFTLTQRVHLLRDLAFKKQAAINTISLTLSVIIAFVLAIMNYGVWALVVQIVSYSFFVSLFMFTTVKFVPTITFSHSSFKELFNFGGKIILHSALKTIYDDSLSLIITKMYSTNLTGLYAQAKKLSSFPSSIFSSLYDTAGFPILSRIEDNKSYKRELSRINKGIFNLALPVLLIVPFQAKNIVFILLGERWLESAPIFSILSISLLTSLISQTSTTVLKSIGRGDYILRYGILNIIIGFIILIITIQISFKAMMYGIVATNLIYSLIIFNVVSKVTLYKWNDLLFDYFFRCLLFILLNFATNLLLNLFSIYNPFYSLILHSLIVMVSFVLYMLFFKRNQINNIIELIIKNKNDKNKVS